MSTDFDENLMRICRFYRNSHTNKPASTPSLLGQPAVNFRFFKDDWCGQLSDRLDCLCVYLGKAVFFLSDRNQTCISYIRANTTLKSLIEIGAEGGLFSLSFEGKSERDAPTHTLCTCCICATCRRSCSTCNTKDKVKLL